MENGTDKEVVKDRVLFADTKTYFGCEVTAVMTENSRKYYPAFPWRFSVKEPSGGLHEFYGIPNYCETKKQALRRGWIRAKWLSEGNWGKHYETVCELTKRANT